MAWEIWRLDLETERIIERQSFGADDGAARSKFNDLQAEAIRDGGYLELRRDGKMITSFRQTGRKPLA